MLQLTPINLVYPDHLNANCDYEKIAKVAHEANRAYCISIGDNSQPRWEDMTDADDWRKDSLYKGVVFHYKNPESTPGNSHTAWMEEKEREGWEYGVVKDVVNKKHPSFICYDKLPEHIKRKDVLFRAICRAMLDDVPTS